MRLESATRSSAWYECIETVLLVSLTSQKQAVLHHVMQDAEDNWQFDIFGLAKQTPGCTLSLLAAHLIGASGLCDEFNIDESKLVNYLQKIESGYNEANPYHNRCLLTKICKRYHHDPCDPAQEPEQSAAAKNYRMADQVVCCAQHCEHGHAQSPSAVPCHSPALRCCIDLQCAVLPTAVLRCPLLSCIATTVLGCLQLCCAVQGCLLLPNCCAAHFAVPSLLPQQSNDLPNDI